MISDGTNLEKQQMIIREKTQSHLDEYAKRGLRTLCIAKKVKKLSEPNLATSVYPSLLKTECVSDLSPNPGTREVPQTKVHPVCDCVIFLSAKIFGRCLCSILRILTHLKHLTCYIQVALYVNSCFPKSKATNILTIFSPEPCI